MEAVRVNVQFYLLDVYGPQPMYKTNFDVIKTLN